VNALARIAAILVTIVGLIAAYAGSAALSLLMGGGYSSSGGMATLIGFIVIFLFFASLALLLWLVARISERMQR
jgi:hypothetical protein